MTQQVILGTPFLEKIMPIEGIDNQGILGEVNKKPIYFSFKSQPRVSFINEISELRNVKEHQISFLHKEIQFLTLEQQLETTDIEEKIKSLHKLFSQEICSDIPTTFWDSDKNIVALPYIDGFNERTIPTKARPSQMKHTFLDLCKKEIQNLLDKKLIRQSYSPWSCTAFYINKNAEKERGVPRLVVNYKPLNDYDDEDHASSLPDSQPIDDEPTMVDYMETMIHILESKSKNK
ncbi:uncharacterized protein [Aristolochia californica]|uniref:uncharacterized protein n=1 Tax=Aristolochia californica TaxID=171875 RepID=UPI0035DDE027